jgi:Protein of unknown function (DUF3489)
MSKAEKPRTRKGGITRKRRQPVQTMDGATKHVGARRGSPAIGKPGTKAGHIIALLKQTAGATLEAIMAATGWQAHSVRGFVSGHLVKKMKLRVRSLRQDGKRVYAIKN